MDTEKQITSDSLAGAGKAPPVQGYKPLAKPTGSQLPKDGLVLAPPEMAEMVLNGEKSLIVKSKKFNIAGKVLLLISQRKALGVIELGEAKELSDEDFTSLETAHRISAETRKEWCEAQPSWCEGPLWAWPVKVLQKFDAPQDTNIGTGPQVVARNVVLKGVTEKIQDVDTYDPSDATDAQLRDDFRILLAWFATWKKNPDAFTHSFETIEALLRKVLKELVRRGPDVIRFNPQGMSASVRSFFEQVAHDVKVPEVMYKALKLAPDSDPEDMTDAELVQAHWDLHHLFSKEAGSQQGVPGWSTEDVVNLHARVVDEMYRRNKSPHPPPPDNGLDELSGDFEEYASDQPKWYELHYRMQKSEFAEIGRSGVKRGPMIKLLDVISHFKTFKLRKPYIYLVGGLANHGETDGDIDILIKDTPDLPEEMKHVIHFRLGRALPAELAERLEIHYDEFHGPFTKFVELYDLTFERVNEQNEVKEMRLKGDEGIEGDGLLDLREYAYAEAVEKNWEPDEEEEENDQHNP